MMDARITDATCVNKLIILFTSYLIELLTIGKIPTHVLIASTTSSNAKDGTLAILKAAKMRDQAVERVVRAALRLPGNVNSDGSTA